MRDLYNFQIGSRAAIYRFYRYSTPVGALKICQAEEILRRELGAKLSLSGAHLAFKFNGKVKGRKKRPPC